MMFGDVPVAYVPVAVPYHHHPHPGMGEGVPVVPVPGAGFGGWIPPGPGGGAPDGPGGVRGAAARRVGRVRRGRGAAEAGGGGEG